MGKFEKLVILTVLLAVAIVLAISFNRGEKKDEGASPLSGAEQKLGAESPLSVDPKTPASGQLEDPKASAEESKGSLLLNAGDEDSASAESAPAAGLLAEPVSDRSARILVGADGLRPSFLDEYMMYTVAEGDTWSTLAQRFYQDGRFTRNLLQANEGMGTLTPGGVVLVPIYDFIQPEAGLQSGAGLAAEPVTAQPPAADPAAAAFLTPPDAKPEVAPVTSAPTTTALVYTVASGDTLSGIALAALGSAQKWPELLELNKDKLTKPEQLKVGMKLALPVGANMPSAAASKPAASPAAKSESKKSESKPTAKAPEAAPKKKKKVL